MLQNPLIIQIVVGVSTLILFWLTLYFFDKAKKYNTNENKKFKAISIILLITTAIGTIYFIANIVTTSTFSAGNVMIAIVKFVVFALAGINIYFYYADGENPFKDLEFQGLMLVISLISSLIIILVPMGIRHSTYEKNIEKSEEQKYSEEEFKLVSIFNSNQIEGAINNIVSTNDYYNTIVEKVVEENEEKEKVVGYEICYIDNETKEKMYTKLDAKNTSIIPIENNKKAYLLKKTYTSYCIDHNQEPPVECRFEEELKYELYVPMEIEEVSTSN